MPLRDHFRPPLTKKSSYEELHGQWPAVIVRQLNDMLPATFVAVPRVHLGSLAEIDVATFENYQSAADTESGGIASATAAWVAPPILSVETELPEHDEYEVRIYDVERDRQLVAAIEIVSPANKDRPDRRNAFIAKCASLLRSGVAVTIVDLVTTRQFNLYRELMEFIGHPDGEAGARAPSIYAASSHWILREPKAVLERWSCPLNIGEPLPKPPLWLTESLVIPLDLEQSYEQACRDLRIE